MNQKNTQPPAVLSGILASAGLVAILCGLTWWQEGSVAAIRCGLKAILPVGLVWMGLFGWLVAAWRSRRRGGAVIASVLFVVWTLVGCDGFVDPIIGRIESKLVATPAPDFENRGERFDAIVLLGGASKTVLPGFPEVQRDGERIVSAAQAWHASATNAIIVTGSSTVGEDHPRDESRQLLRSLGVPDERIYAIEGVNTHAEMVSLKQLLNDPPPGLLALKADSPEESDSPEKANSVAKIGLVTSAFHMPRAMRLARQNGLDLVPLPCAFRQDRSDRPWSAANLIPGAGTIETLGLAIKETIAQLAGQ